MGTSTPPRTRSVAWSDRYAAASIDVFVAALLGAVAVDLLERLGASRSTAVFAAGVLVAVSAGLLDAFGAATLGRYLAGLRVRSRDGAAAGVLRGIARWLVPVLPVVIGSHGAFGWLGVAVVIAGVDLALAAGTGRSLLDRVTGTMVVRRPRGASPQAGFAFLDSGAPLRRRRAAGSRRR